MTRIDTKMPRIFMKIGYGALKRKNGGDENPKPLIIFLHSHLNPEEI